MTDDVKSAATRVYQVFIRTTPERVWEAITSPAFTRQYFYGASHRVDAEHLVSIGPDGSTWMDVEVHAYAPPGFSPAPGPPTTTPTSPPSPRAA